MNISRIFYWVFLEQILDAIQTKLFFSEWRIKLLRLFGAKIGEGCYIDRYVSFMHAYVNSLRNFEIGNQTKIYRETLIDLQQPVIIGNRCAISPGVFIFTHAQPCDSELIKRYSRKEGSVIIENDVWICTRAVILPGVKIGSHSIVAAGAVVTDNVPENSLVAGVPAKVKKIIW